MLLVVLNAPSCFANLDALRRGTAIAHVVVTDAAHALMRIGGSSERIEVGGALRSRGGELESRAFLLVLGSRLACERAVRWRIFLGRCALLARRLFMRLAHVGIVY